MRVAVVGAGITGLALTHHLANADVDVVTFEAASEPGGVMRSRTVDGRILEDGPQRLRRTDEFDDLVADLDLAHEILVAADDPPLYVYVDGQLRKVPKTVSDLVTSDILTWRDKLGLLSEPFSASLNPEEMIADEFRRKFGNRIYRNLIEPIVGGMYGSDPEEMPVGYALERIVSFESQHRSLLTGALKRARSNHALPPVVSFESGVQTLARALYEEHEPYINLNQPVTSIERFMGGQFAVRTSKGSVGVDHVVLTTPAKTTASLLADIEDCYAEPLTNLRYNSLAVVHLDAELDRSGFGYQVPRGEGISTLGVTWNGPLLGRDNIQTAFLGGMWEPELLDRPHDELGELAAEEFETVTGEPASVIDVTQLPEIIPAFDRSWSAIDDIALSEDVTIASNYTARVGIPGRLREAKQVARDIAAIELG